MKPKKTVSQKEEALRNKPRNDKGVEEVKPGEAANQALLHSPSQCEISRIFNLVVHRVILIRIVVNS